MLGIRYFKADSSTYVIRTSGGKVLDRMTVPEAIRYMEEGHFAPGSMLPKVLAAIKFARTFPGRKAIITSLDRAVEALEGTAGTVVTMA